MRIKKFVTHNGTEYTDYPLESPTYKSIVALGNWNRKAKDSTGRQFAPLYTKKLQILLISYFVLNREIHYKYEICLDHSQLLDIIKVAIDVDRYNIALIKEGKSGCTTRYEKSILRKLCDEYPEEITYVGQNHKIKDFVDNNDEEIT